MSLNSVNTNVGAIIALESLNRTNQALNTTQKQVSTGFRVADATDDGAAFAIAQSVRSTVGALTSANQQLGNVQGLLNVSQSGLTDVSNTMASMRDVLVKLSDGDIKGNDRANYVAQYNTYLDNLKTFINDATYNGKTLVGSFDTSNGGPGGFGRVAVARNENGASYGITTFDGSGLYGSISFGTTSTGTFATATAVASLITASGTFINQMNAVGMALNKIGASINYVSNQITYNNDKVDALNSGLGSLVDADLAKESAQLQSLQIRQQLGTQALSLANQAPQTLLSLFK